MFVNKLAAGVVLGVGLMSAGGAFAAETADISVIGTITPASCDIVLTNANINHGNIAIKSLNADTTKELSKKTVGVNVACDAPTKFALSTAPADGSTYSPETNVFGLGRTADNNEFGYFSLRFDGTTLNADTAAVVGLTSADKTTWAPAPTAEPGAVVGPALHNGVNYLAFAAAGTDVGDITEFNGELEVRTFIAPADELALVDEEAFDASATIVVNYL